MKVLLIAGSLPPMKCGVGDYTDNLARALSAIPQMKVAVLTSTSAQPRAKDDNIQVYPVVTSWNLLGIFPVIRIILKWSPDIVHIQYPTQGYRNGFLPWLLPLISFLMGKKTVQTWHEPYAGKKLPKLLLKLIFPSRIIVVRPNFMEILHPVLRKILYKKGLIFIKNASSIPKVELSADERSYFRKKYLGQQKRLIVFFGFIYEHKGVDLLFEIANPLTDQLVIAGDIDDSSDFQKKISELASTPPWTNRVTITGFLPAHEVAALLSAADAVVFPFRTGGGEWNSSIHAAVLQGAFVIATSTKRNGYDSRQNIFYSAINDVNAMQQALNLYSGFRRGFEADIDTDEWEQIAKEHCMLYERL